MFTDTRRQLKRDYSTAMFGRINSYKLDSLFLIRKPDLKVSQDQNIVPTSSSQRRLKMKPSAKPLILVLLALLMIALSSCTPAPHCAPIYNVTKTADTNDGVCSPSDCSLREAVNNANACDGSHTINLPAGGYTLTIDGDDEEDGATGDLDIVDDLTVGTDLTIVGTAAPSIHGGIERSFHIHNGATVVFDHIWLADGSAIIGGGLINEGDLTLNSFTCNYNSVAMPYGTMGDAKGGCIYNTSNLTINGGQFLANNAKLGGAIFNETNAVMTIQDGDFTGNIAEQHGGAILNGHNASATIDGGLYRLNEAGGHGGAVWNTGPLTAANQMDKRKRTSIIGGAVFNWAPGVMEIFYGQFLANNAEYGGAIYNETNAVFSSIDSDYTGNIAVQHGGAIHNAQDATLTTNGGQYSLNEAGNHGGAIWNNGSYYAINLVFEENTAVNNGGGVYNWAPGTTHLGNVWFTLNSADLGGGLFNSEGMVHVNRGGLTANTASTGGGLYNQGPAPSTGMFLQNVTISGNTATGGLGAGIFTDSNFDFRFITIADNAGEGLRVDGGLEIKLRSSALSNNSGGDCAGITPDSLDYNIVSDSTCALIGPHDLLATDPLLEPLAHHGGWAPSHALGVGSPALDSGVPDLCIAEDQPGSSRPQGPWCDRGAHENIYTKGIVRGWTYIDANRNDHRDPTDGSMSGVMLHLKEGACPGGLEVAMATSATGGFYEIIDIEPGDYCLERSMIQQTLYPDYYDLTFGPGDVLEDINFRYLLSPLGNSSISGKVWHDECAVPYATPLTPPPGCIWLPSGGLGADGLYDSSEPGIAGVKVDLYSGGCPAGPIAVSAVVYTDANGDFTIPSLTDHGWCVVVNAGTPPNDSILIPGNWTYPVRDASPAETEVTLGSSEDVVDVNFGWDYQFLPSPPIPYSFICKANQNAFGRFAPDIRSKQLFVLLEGNPFEVLAKSEQYAQDWWFGKTEADEFGWVADTVLDCEGIDPEQVLIREAPEFEIMEPDQKPDDDGGEDDGDEIPQDSCSTAPDAETCKKEGGKWNINTNSCVCP